MKQLALAIALVVATGAFAADASAPKVSDTLKVQILQVQKQLLTDQVQANQYQQAINQLQADFTAKTAKLADLTKQAYKEAGVTDKDYTFDPDTQTFTPAKPAGK